MSGTRSLSRNPLTQWQRLVEDNLTSLGGTPLRRSTPQCVSSRNTIVEDIKDQLEETEILENDLESCRALYQGQSKRIGKNGKLLNADIINPEMTTKTIIPVPHNELRRPLISRKKTSDGGNGKTDRRKTGKTLEQSPEHVITLNATNKNKMHSADEKTERYDIMEFKTPTLKNHPLTCNQNHTRLSLTLMKRCAEPKGQDNCESTVSRNSNPMSTMAQTSKSLGIKTPAVAGNGDTIATEHCRNKNPRTPGYSQNETSPALMDCFPQHVADGHRGMNASIKQRRRSKESVAIKKTPRFRIKQGDNMSTNSNKYSLDRLSRVNPLRFHEAANSKTIIHKSHLIPSQWQWSSDNHVEGIGDGFWHSRLQMPRGFQDTTSCLQTAHRVNTKPNIGMKSIALPQTPDSNTVFIFNTEMTSIGYRAHHDFGGGGDLTFQTQIFTDNCRIDRSIDWFEREYLDIPGIPIDVTKQFYGENNSVNTLLEASQNALELFKERRVLPSCNRYKINLKRTVRSSTLNAKSINNSMVRCAHEMSPFESGEELPESFSEPIRTSMLEHKTYDEEMTNLLISGRLCPQEKKENSQLSKCRHKISDIGENGTVINKTSTGYVDFARSMKISCHSKPTTFFLSETIFLKPEGENNQEFEKIQSFDLKSNNLKVENKNIKYKAALVLPDTSLNTVPDDISTSLNGIRGEKNEHDTLAILTLSQIKNKRNTLLEDSSFANGESFTQVNNKAQLYHFNTIETRDERRSKTDATNLLDIEKGHDERFPVVKELWSSSEIVQEYRQPLLTYSIEQEYETTQVKRSIPVRMGKGDYLPCSRRKCDAEQTTTGLYEIKAIKARKYTEKKKTLRNEVSHSVETPLFSSESLANDSNILEYSAALGNSANKMSLSASFGLDTMTSMNARDILRLDNDQILNYDEIGPSPYSIASSSNITTSLCYEHQSTADDSGFILQPLSVREYPPTENKMIELSHPTSEAKIQATENLYRGNMPFSSPTFLPNDPGGYLNSSLNMTGDRKEILMGDHQKAEVVWFQTDTAVSDDTNSEHRERSTRIYSTDGQAKIDRDSKDRLITKQEHESALNLLETRDKDNTTIDREEARTINAQKSKSFKCNKSTDNNSSSCHTLPANDVFLPKGNEFYRFSVQNIQPQQNFQYLDDIFSDGKTSDQVDCVGYDIDSGNRSEMDENCATRMENEVESSGNDDLNQSSLECLLEQLIQRGKITKACVLALDRKMLAHSRYASISQHDVNTLCDGALGHYDGLMKITLFDEVVYTCFQWDDYTVFMGRSRHSVLVCKVGSNSLVAGFASPYTSGSCLKEITEFADVLKGRGL